MDKTLAIKRAVEAVGSQAALSRAICAPPALVWQWLDGRRPVAPKHCIPIETATAGAVTRHDLRPDIFGPAPTADEAKAA